VRLIAPDSLVHFFIVVDRDPREKPLRPVIVGVPDHKQLHLAILHVHHRSGPKATHRHEKSHGMEGYPSIVVTGNSISPSPQRLQNQYDIPVGGLRLLKCLVTAEAMLVRKLSLNPLTGQLHSQCTNAALADRGECTYLPQATDRRPLFLVAITRRAADQHPFLAVVGLLPSRLFEAMLLSIA
jgi:hypothetical protein